MEPEESQPSTWKEEADSAPACPVCGARLVQEKCKVVCRSEICVYRIVFNCSEF